MPRLSANLSMLYTDLPFLDRFAAAGRAGFAGVEVQFPYHHAAEMVADKAGMAEVPVVLINAPPGDWAAGERGLAAVPGREQDFRESLELALDYADFIDCPRLHVMAGIVPEEDWEEALEVYIANLAYAAAEAQGRGIKILIEPINPIDMPGYFLRRPADAAQVLEVVDHPNLYMLYDLYHAQMTQGGLTEFLETYLERIAHIQVAGVPGRHEPDRLSEVNYGFLFDLLDGHGYDGFVGAEYKPRGGTDQGLKWAAQWLTPRDLW